MSDFLDTLPRLQFSFEDAAAALNLPVSTLELECRRGRGPLFFTVGRRKFTTPDLIREWQEQRIAEARTLSVEAA